jgi:hypothetical protein
MSAKKLNEPELMSAAIEHSYNLEREHNRLRRQSGSHPSSGSAKYAVEAVHRPSLVKGAKFMHDLIKKQGGLNE